MIANVPEREEFLFLFSTIFREKTDLAEFFTQSYRDNPNLPTSTNCQTYAYIPKGLPGSVKSLLHLFSSAEDWRAGRTEGSQLPYLYLSQSPSPRARIFRLALSQNVLLVRRRRTSRKGKTGRRDKLPRVKASACIHLHGVSTVIGTIPHSRARNERRASSLRHEVTR